MYFILHSNCMFVKTTVAKVLLAIPVIKLSKYVLALNREVKYILDFKQTTEDLPTTTLYGYGS